MRERGEGAGRGEDVEDVQLLQGGGAPDEGEGVILRGGRGAGEELGVEGQGFEVREGSAQGGEEARRVAEGEELEGYAGDGGGQGGDGEGLGEDGGVLVEFDVGG